MTKYKDGSLISKDSFFVEKHNSFIKDGKPDDDYWEAKQGLWQYRITTVHFETKEKAFEALEQLKKVFESERQDR